MTGAQSRRKDHTPGSKPVFGAVCGRSGALCSVSSAFARVLFPSQPAWTLTADEVEPEVWACLDPMSGYLVVR